MTALNHGLVGASARRLEFRHKRPDGREIDIGLSATHLETPGGRAGYLITFQDLTDVKKLENDARMQPASGGGRRNGCRYRARDQKSARVDVRDPFRSCGRNCR